MDSAAIERMLSFRLLKAIFLIMRDQKQSALHTTEPSAAFGLLKISGPDAKKFLQGQLTCHLDHITEEASALGAHCNPQGRVLFLFRIFYIAQAYYLLMPKEMVEKALSSLKKYAIFFKLSMAEADFATDPSLAAQATCEWQLMDLHKGFAKIYPETSGHFLPHELNLHVLGGLSFEKGCYTGQEIIARLHYRGKLKTQLYRAKISNASVPERGAELYSPEGSGNAVLVDYCQASYTQAYELLVLTTEVSRQQNFKLNSHSNEIWEWLT